MSTPETATKRPSDRELALACARLALDRKARDVRVIFVGDRLGIAEYFVLATVNNRRQARAVRDSVRLGLKGLGFGVPDQAHEDPAGRWSLFDYGGVVLRRFGREGRPYFDLDAVRTTPTMDPAVAAGIGIIGLIFWLIMITLSIIIFCKIFSKTGYGWAMGLLMLIPIANFIMLLVLAFSEWPIQKELRALKAQPTQISE